LICEKYGNKSDAKDDINEFQIKLKEVKKPNNPEIEKCKEIRSGDFRHQIEVIMGFCPKEH